MKTTLLNRAAVGLFALLLAPSLSHAASFGSNLTHSVQILSNRLITQIEPPLVTVIFSPTEPMQGDSITAFIHVETRPADAAKIRTFLVAKLDGQDFALSNPSDPLWVAKIGAYSAISAHDLHVSTYIEDLSESAETKNEIEQLNQDILALQSQIQSATDPTQLAILQGQMNQKIADRAILAQTLLGLRRLMGEDDFNFQVAANTASTNFPHISQVNPGYTVQNGPVSVNISGTDLAGPNRSRLYVII